MLFCFCLFGGVGKGGDRHRCEKRKVRLNSGAKIDGKICCGRCLVTEKNTYLGFLKRRWGLIYPVNHNIHLDQA